MHSNRIRTVCSSGRISLGGCTWFQGGIWWGVYLVPGGLPGHRGGVPGPGGVYLVPGGVPGSRGCTWSQGGSWWAVYLVYLVPEVYLVTRGCSWSRGCTWSRGGCTLSGTPHCGQTDACKHSLCNFVADGKNVIN